MAFRVVYWNGVALLFALMLTAAAGVRRFHLLDKLIVESSRQHNVDPRLVSAVVWKESRYDPNSMGKAGEIGLMQVTEGALQDWAEVHPTDDVVSKEELFRPALNLEVGTWYLARSLNYWSSHRDPLPYALAEYNAGRGNVQRWIASSENDQGPFLDQIGYPTTKRYVRDILKRYRGDI